MPLPRSEWFEDVRSPFFPTFSGEREVDVVIIGGGITGVTAAHALQQAGTTVALVEARRLGFGVTGHTSAHLTALPDTPFSELELAFGGDGARGVWNTQMAAIDHIGSLVKSFSIDCDFARVPAFLYAEDQDGASFVAEQADVATRLGIPFKRSIDTPLPYPVEAAIRFDDQGQLQPMKYVAALSKAIESERCHIYENTRALEIELGDTCVVTTDDGRIRARKVIIATHSPIGLILTIHTRIAGYRSYCISVELNGELPDGLFYDTADPYHYIRRHHDHLIIGGEDHKTGHGKQDADHWTRLEDWTRARFDVKRVVKRWSAQVFEPADGIPYIGRLTGTDNVLFATGFSGNGLTFGTAAGLLLADLALGRENRQAALYDPSRAKPIASAPSMARENADVAYRFIRDRLTPGEAKDLDDVPNGEGRIVRVDGKKLAAYRDEQGALKTMSAVCPHAGCIVQWNGAEKSWDCPCHASRFTSAGQVLDGPAVRALDSAEKGARVFGRRKKTTST